MTQLSSIAESSSAALQPRREVQSHDGAAAMQLGHYHLQTQTWSSPDAVAYRALDTRSGRLVEIRVLGGALGDPRRWEKLTRRLRVAALVRHPGARRICEVSLASMPFHVVLEWLEQPCLTAALSGSLPLPTPQAIAWCRGLAATLAAAHRLGLVHGRLAPGSLRRGPARVPQLDFTGLEPISSAPFAELDVGFRPPGPRGPAPDFAADVFRLGAVMVWLLTGQPPRPDVEETLATLGQPAADLKWLLRGMLDPDPAERLTAHEVEFGLASMMPQKKTAEPENLERTAWLPADVTAERSADPLKGRQLGRFHLRDKLGEGGMGEVWRAEDAADGSLVAIKVLRPDWVRQPTALKRFHKEARLLGEVRHPNVAALLEVNEDRGIHYLVLELVAGHDLDKVMSERGTLDERQALAIASEVARALEDAHQRGIVHRDIKPGNVILLDGSAEASAPRIKLLDFGLARHVTQSESLHVTEAGTMVGTPLYMAPEQGMGQDIDPRADVYSLGATLYHMLAGRPPFQSDSALGVMTQHAFETAPPVRDLNPEVSEGTSRIVDKCLAKTPAGRYGDAGALRRDIERLLRGEPTSLVLHPQTPRCDPEDVVRYEWSWDLRGSPEQLWPFVCNTERLNRAAKLPSVSYETRPAESGGSRRFGRFRKAGFENVWEEHPFEWIEGQQMGVLRVYREGILRWLASVVELHPRGDGGTRLVHRILYEPAGLLGRVAGIVEIGFKFRRAVDRIYRRVDGYLGHALGDPALADPFEPPTTLAGGPRRRLQLLLGQLADEGSDPLVVERLGEFLASAPAQEVARIRPLALARRLGLDQDQVVTACLRGARNGLLVLLWDVLCPICRIPSEVKDTLRELKRHGRCEACNLDYELDFANAIELVFRVHPEIRPTEVGVYCIGGPSHSPHVVVQARVAPRETMELDLSLAEGAYRIRGPQLPWSLDFQVEPNGPASRWDVRLSEGLRPDYPRSLSIGRQALTVTNDFAHEVLVRLERTAPRADALTAARASALALFRQLFPAEVLSPGNLIGIANVTLLATDVDGARRLYRRLGDARAFALIHEHLQVLEAEVGRQGGAFIRTSGTGTLAVFHQPVAAVRAGLALAAAVRANEKTRPLRLRVGIHSGPALAATMNDKLDYFGATVTALEEVLDTVRGGELVLTHSVATNPEVVAVLQRQDLEGRLVKGESSDHPLAETPGLVFRLPASTPAGQTAPR